MNGTVKSLSIIGSSTLSVGVPERLEELLIQTATAIAVWLVTKLLDKIKKNPNK